MKRSEIWMADMGALGKVRPVLVLSIPCNEEECAIVSYRVREYPQVIPCHSIRLAPRG